MLVEDVSPAEVAPRYVPVDHYAAAAYYRLARARVTTDEPAGA